MRPKGFIRRSNNNAHIRSPFPDYDESEESHGHECKGWRAAGVVQSAFEHDNCGVGFVATIDGPPSHHIVDNAVRVLVNLEHRGAVNSDQATGDGAGILVQLPDRFLRERCRDDRIPLPEADEYGVGMVFLPTGEAHAHACMTVLERIAEEERCPVLGWREVPVDPAAIGDLARKTRLEVRQLFLSRGPHTGDVFERKLYVIRRRVEKEIEATPGSGMERFYIPSLSSRKIVYKGFMNGADLPRFYPDLRDENFQSRFAVIHQRYSTNTFPSWSLAHPFRYVAHNGEINTLSGNKNHMRSREADMASPLFGDDLEKVLPVIAPGGSDSSTFDNVLELLVMAGRSLPHAMMMLIPEAWGSKYLMSEDKRAFYEYHARSWSHGTVPSAMVFTDGRYVGATLDRNGLRPARYTVTQDGLIFLASEAGVLDIPVERIRSHGRLQPGRMFLLDLELNRIIPDNVIKSSISRQKPYRHWVRNNRIELRGLLAPTEIQPEDPVVLRHKHRAFGYTEGGTKAHSRPHGRSRPGAGWLHGRRRLPGGAIQSPATPVQLLQTVVRAGHKPPIDPLRKNW